MPSESALHVSPRGDVQAACPGSLSRPSGTSIGSPGVDGPRWRVVHPSRVPLPGRLYASLAWPGRWEVTFWGGLHYQDQDPRILRDSLVQPSGSRCPVGGRLALSEQLGQIPEPNVVI